MKCTCAGGEFKYNCLKHGLTDRAIKYRRWRVLKIIGVVLGTLLMFRIAYVQGLHLTEDHRPHIRIAHFRVMSALIDCDLMVRDADTNWIGQLDTKSIHCPKWEEGDSIDMEYWPEPCHCFIHKYEDNEFEERYLEYREAGFSHEFTDKYDD